MSSENVPCRSSLSPMRSNWMASPILGPLWICVARIDRGITATEPVSNQCNGLRSQVFLATLGTVAMTELSR